MGDIKLYVENPSGAFDEVPAPTDFALNLMEVLKGNGYPIEARCGGMALCATCHIEVLNNPELPEQGDAELEMLDVTPNLTQHSRLACQLRITQELDGLELRILGEE